MDSISTLTNIDDDVKQYLRNWGVNHLADEMLAVNKDPADPPPVGEWECTQHQGKGSKSCPVHRRRRDVPPGARCLAYAVAVDDVEFSGNPRGYRYFQYMTNISTGRMELKASFVRFDGQIMTAVALGLVNSHKTGSAAARRAQGLDVYNPNAPAHEFTGQRIADLMALVPAATEPGNLALPFCSRDELAYKLGTDANTAITRVKHACKKYHGEPASHRLTILLGLRLQKESKRLVKGLLAGHDVSQHLFTGLSVDAEEDSDPNVDIPTSRVPTTHLPPLFQHLGHTQGPPPAQREPYGWAHLRLTGGMGGDAVPSGYQYEPTASVIPHRPAAGDRSPARPVGVNVPWQRQHVDGFEDTYRPPGIAGMVESLEQALTQREGQVGAMRNHAAYLRQALEEEGLSPGERLRRCARCWQEMERVLNDEDI